MKTAQYLFCLQLLIVRNPDNGKFKKNYSFGNIFKGYYSHLENAGFFALRKVGLINYTFENTDDINDERLKVYAKKTFLCM